MTEGSFRSKCASMNNLAQFDQQSHESTNDVSAGYASDDVVHSSGRGRERKRVLGIAIVNDFKSIEGDRQMGLQSLPVAFGSETAKWIYICWCDRHNSIVRGYLLGAGKLYYALALLGLIAPQIFFQFKYFLKDPVKYDVK
ncbi:hypothetical protein CASFOL_030594 [Castilleja foliolosa]|uniref:Uncharacterized protein n=1 Tax=Castilleja foliolosa TaxID=1961234 RepID=A0ABD3C5R9_9LAMI